MKQVITLVGLKAGHLVWMNTPEAESAVAVGTARWPTQAEIMNGGPIEEKKPAAPGGDDEFVYLKIASSDAGPSVPGGWPRKAVLTPKMKNSIFVEEPKSGVFHINVGGKRAVYHLSDNVGGESYVELFKELDDAEDEDEDEVEAAVEPKAEEAEEDEDEAERPADSSGDAIEIPAGWESMHWKKRITLAAEISGEEPENVGEAMKIIHEYVNRK